MKKIKTHIIREMTRPNRAVLWCGMILLSDKDEPEDIGPAVAVSQEDKCKNCLRAIRKAKQEEP